MKRERGVWITEEYATLEFVATWSGSVTGFIFGYKIDRGEIEWLPPAKQDTPQIVEIPPGAHEEAGGPARWTLYWEPSTEHTPRTGGWVGPGSYNVTVRAFPLLT